MTDLTHAQVLGALALADPQALHSLAEALLPALMPVEVVHSRTGLIMLPLRDTVKGTDFHLGEVLVAEAHIRAGGRDGYGLLPGRDLDRAMAMAVADLAWQQGGPAAAQVAALAATARADATARDANTFRAVEATRVQMETF
jgi:alpha-D-ribose 1-methylphosphonate 5-triphosphate synthase subunit PhnG